MRIDIFFDLPIKDFLTLCFPKKKASSVHLLASIDSFFLLEDCFVDKKSQTPSLSCVCNSPFRDWQTRLIFWELCYVIAISFSLSGERIADLDLCVRDQSSVLSLLFPVWMIELGNAEAQMAWDCVSTITTAMVIFAEACASLMTLFFWLELFWWLC